MHELVHTYEEQCRNKLTLNLQTLIYVTSFQGLNVNEYAVARREHCRSSHSVNCRECSALLNVADVIVMVMYP